MMRITRNVLESYMACHYKAYLKLAGHDYPPAHERKLQPPGASQDGLTPSDRVLPPLVGSQAHKSTYLTPKILSAGLPNISDALYETALISLHFDGLQRVPGLSDLGGFHYVPILLHSGGGVHEIHKCLLDIYGFVLSQLQGRLPEKGIVWRDEGKSSTLSLSQGLKKGERILNALLAMQSNTQRPTLILNGHCQICEFQNRCHAQAA